jgi:hypothetical protein
VAAALSLGTQLHLLAQVRSVSYNTSGSVCRRDAVEAPEMFEHLDLDLPALA